MNSSAANSAADGSADQPATRSLPKRRRRVFRVAAIIFALLLLPMVEGVLRLLDLGPNVDLVVPVRPATTDDPVFTHQFNGPADLPFFGQADVAGPEERPFVLPKPDETYRIVVLGASTVIGFPYGPPLAFPRQLEWQLKRRHPEQDFEVLNAGITSMNSFAVSSLAEQCLQAEPDLVIVYAGHNEFYGPGGPASSAFNLSPDVIRFCYQMRRWRSVQLLTQLTSAQNQLSGDLLDVLPDQLQIPLDGPVFRQAKQNYEANLMRMVNSCTQAGVDVLLTTVACNLQDQSPLFSIWPSESNDGREEFDSLIQQAGTLVEQKKYSDALTLVKRATTIVPHHADLSYRLGQCYAGLGQDDLAYAAFSRARDLDGCRFRIPSGLQVIPKTVAEQFPKCQFFDLAGAVRASSSRAAPGHDLFLEHVHFNFDGHYLVARLLAEQVLQKYFPTGNDPDVQAASIDDIRQKLGFIPEDDLAAVSFAIQVYQTGPFSRTLDRERHVRFLSDQATRLFEAIPAVRGQVFAELPMDHMSAGLVYFLLERHRAAGNRAVAEELQNCLQRRIPWKVF